MEMVLRTSGTGVNGQRNRAIRHFRPPRVAHDGAPLPRLPEEVRRQRIKQQRAFCAIDTVSGHQQILQRAVAVFKQHIAALGVNVDAGFRRPVLLLIWHVLL